MKKNSMADSENQEIVITGIAASPGICIGKAYLVDREGVNVIKKYHIPGSDIEPEKNRLRNAVVKARDELRSIIEDSPAEFRQHTGILETHVVLLEDKMLYGKTLEMIERERINAEWALKKVVSDLKRVFQDMTDPYFRERAADIVHVSDRIFRNLSGVEAVNIKAIDKRVILIATDLSPAQTSQIQLERIKGIATNGGGAASHTGIIARTLEIPAILGLRNATKIVKNDDLVILDGTSGKLIVRPAEETLLEYEERSEVYEAHRARISRSSQFPAQTLDGFTIPILGNIDLPEEIVAVRDYGGNGIGLYRTEFQYMGRIGFPTEEQLFERYRDVVEIMAPYPVTIRTLDINGDKTMPYVCDIEEPNPVLGLRAIRYCLKKPHIFKIQLRAILRAAAYGNVRIMFPMISNCDEVRAAKALLRETATSLEKDGVKFNPNIDVGIMIEVPSAAVMADVLAREVDFFSIGTNDLIQYLLAIDRSNQYVSHLYKPLHPAVIRMLKRVADEAHRNGISVYMCGEMASNPIHLPILLGLGIDELSTNPQSIPVVKNAIRSLSLEGMDQLMEQVLEKSSDMEIEHLMKEKYGHLLSSAVYTPSLG